METSFLTKTLLLTSVLTLGACGGNTSTTGQESQVPQQGAAQIQQSDVEFDLDFSALLEREISPTLLNDVTTGGSAANIMTGNMEVTNLDTSEVELHPWTINLDESDLTDVQSFKTLALTPGNYVFALALNKATHSYAGSVVHTLTDGATDIVSMIIRPIIGDSQVDVNVISELIDFKFSYSDAEINTAGLVNPTIGITIGNGLEQLFALDPATGLTEHMFLNLIPGQHDISLRLLDSGIQVGKSIEAQESVTVTQGLDVSMDIIPLHGEFALALAVEGGDATLNLQVPAEVIEEAGGVSNLQTLLSVAGPQFPVQEQAISLTATNSFYTSSVVLTNLFYGELTFEMAFNDLTTGEPLGYCVNSTVISNTNTPIECELTLRRRQIVSGSLMSTLGVNVTDTSGLLVPGAVVTIDGDEVAITNSGAFSTAGYSKVYVKPGLHIIRAQIGPVFGEASYESIPLGVDNIDIALDQIDTDDDGLVDNLDSCPTEAAATQNGCPGLTYAIGDVGPAGGIVFYIANGGLNGLEAAPTEQTSATWGCIGIDVPGADGINVGTGASNTVDILAAGCGAGNAAEIADAYTGPDGSTTGWFLPSQDELSLMFTELSIFAQDFYWSSSESGLTLALVPYPGLVGTAPSSHKGDMRRVHVARVF